MLRLGASSVGLQKGLRTGWVRRASSPRAPILCPKQYSKWCRGISRDARFARKPSGRNVDLPDGRQALTEQDLCHLVEPLWYGRDQELVLDLTVGRGRPHT